MPGPGVGDIEHQHILVRPRVDVNRSAPRAVFERIRQQIIQNQLEFRAIGAQLDVLNLEIQVDSLREQRQLMRFQRRLDQRPQTELS